MYQNKKLRENKKHSGWLSCGSGVGWGVHCCQRQDRGFCIPYLVFCLHCAFGFRRSHIYTMYTILVRVWKGPSGQSSYFNGLIKLLQLRLQLCFSKCHKEHSKIFTTIMSWSENDEWLLFFSLCAQSLSHGQLFVTPWTVACQAPLLMKFSRQQYWSLLLPPSLLFFFFICIFK